MQADGSGMRQLTDDPHLERLPSWSPDDTQLAFSSNRTGKYEIWVINADGSGLRQLTHVPGAQVLGPIWSPDGARLVCNLIGGDPFIIEANKPWNDQRPEPLPSFGRQGVSFGVRSWSRDGTKLAGDLRRPQGVAFGLVVYSFADHKYEQLTDFGGRPQWLSDSRRLVFHDESKIYLFDTRSRKVREIYSSASRNIEQNNHLGISPDDRWIYFSLATNEADIWLMTTK
jgi:Tol biopolymer transport system component